MGIFAITLPLALFNQVWVNIGKSGYENRLENLKKFGFLFIGYKKSFYFWEFIIFIRKILTVVIYVAYLNT